MTVNEMRELFAYGAWANARTFAAAAELSDEELTKTIVSSFPSVRATLGHIVEAEWWWLRCWRGEGRVQLPGWVTDSPLAELRAGLETLERERLEYLSGLSDAELGRSVPYGPPDKGMRAPLGEMMRHVVNHSTYHRGQVATQLRQLGKTPPTTDLIAYLRQG